MIIHITISVRLCTVCVFDGNTGNMHKTSMIGLVVSNWCCVNIGSSYGSVAARYDIRCEIWYTIRYILIWDSINNSKNQIRTQTKILRVTSNIASRKWLFSFCIVSDQHFSEQIENSSQNVKVRKYECKLQATSRWPISLFELEKLSVI